MVSSNGTVTFIPGAMRDESALTLTMRDGVNYLSWNFANTGFGASFVSDQGFSFDFETPIYVERVTPDEFLKSFGAFPFGSGGNRITVFGKPTSAPEGGSTALLLITAVVILGGARHCYRG